MANTPELDAIAVIGHSGATGADSNGDGRDVPANSWATGDNPDVDSIYNRLLASHPAIAGHNYNNAVSGSDVSSLMGQAEALFDPKLNQGPAPDIVLIQSIDNDLRCDGTDEDNYDPFEGSIDEVLAYLFEANPAVHVFFVDQWGSVAHYDDMAAKDPGIVRYLSGSGVCDTFSLHGKRNPKAEAYLQNLVDSYFARIVQACSKYAGCATDEGANQAMTLERSDITDDYNHLTVQGQAKMAALEWKALSSAWK